MGIKIPGVNPDWRNALVGDPQHQLGFEKYSPTSYVEKAIPADSVLHPHSRLLTKEEEEKRKEARRKEKEEELNKMRSFISSSSYKPLSATKNMSKGGRTRPVDGCAIKGKTKPPVF